MNAAMHAEVCGILRAILDHQSRIEERLAAIERYTGEAVGYVFPPDDDQPGEDEA